MGATRVRRFKARVGAAKRKRNARVTATRAASAAPVDRAVRKNCSAAWWGEEKKE